MGLASAAASDGESKVVRNGDRCAARARLIAQGVEVDQVDARTCQLAVDVRMPLTIAGAAFGQALLASWRILMPSRGLQVISHVVVSNWR